MCLSTVVREGSCPPEEILKNVASLELLEDGSIRLFDILGRSTVIQGQLKKLDFLENIITISE